MCNAIRMFTAKADRPQIKPLGHYQRDLTWTLTLWARQHLSSSQCDLLCSATPNSFSPRRPWLLLWLSLAPSITREAHCWFPIGICVHQEPLLFTLLRRSGACRPMLPMARLWAPLLSTAARPTQNKTFWGRRVTKSAPPAACWLSTCQNGSTVSVWLLMSYKAQKRDHDAKWLLLWTTEQLFFPHHHNPLIKKVTERVVSTTSVESCQLVFPPRPYCWRCAFRRITYTLGCANWIVNPVILTCTIIPRH